MTPIQKTYLFTDVRHIRCGDLEWVSPDGQRLPVAGPPLPEVEARSRTGMLPYGIRLAAQQAIKMQPLPKTGRFGRVVFDSGLYRSWYLHYEHRPGENLGAYSTQTPLEVGIGYSESKDGFEWVERGRCTFPVRGQTGFDGFGVFIDPRGPASERYKVVYSARPPEGERPALWAGYQKVHPRYRDVRMREHHLYAMYGVVSPDGLNWEALPEPLMVHMSDTDTTVYYDDWLERYVMYTRLYWQERRWVGRAEAEDFRRWGPVQPFLWPDLGGSLSDDIYTNGRTEYPGLPGYHFLFPMVYHRFQQTSDIRLYSSADGICWMAVPGGPVIAPGEAGSWDSEFLGAGKDLVPLGTDRVAIPYGGTSYPHKYPRWARVLEAVRAAWAWWPKGRLCAVVADQVGEFHTFGITPGGRELRINVRTRRGSEVRVGLAGVPGRSVDDCDPVTGDHLAWTVRWRGQSDLGVQEGEKVSLHFKLRSAEVFGFEWV